MSKISGKETKPEILVRKFLFSKGFRYRKNVHSLPGKPDIVLPKFKTLVFIHGCYWHGHKNCRYSKLPETNKVFWLEKISKNVIRDRISKNILKKLGWKVIDIWQCEIKTTEKREQRFRKLIKEIKK